MSMLKLSSRIALMTVVAFLATVVSVSLPAQTVQTTTFDVPFDFTVGEKTFPAGKYNVKTGMAQGAVLIQSEDYHSALFVMTHGVQARKEAEKPTLVFNRYPGGHTYLNQLWIAGSDTGRQFLQSKAEREIARQASKPEEATIAAAPKRGK